MITAEATEAAAKAIADADIEGQGVPEYSYLAKRALRAALPHLTAAIADDFVDVWPTFAPAHPGIVEWIRNSGQAAS